jgi:hypothetical protein
MTRLQNRVTRLGEFSPLGRLFILSIFKITVVAKIFFLIQRRSFLLLFAKLYWATFLAIFHTAIWDRCYDCLNIFAEKFDEKIGVLGSKHS